MAVSARRGPVLSPLVFGKFRLGRARSASGGHPGADYEYLSLEIPHRLERRFYRGAEYPGDHRRLKELLRLESMARGTTASFSRSDSQPVRLGQYWASVHLPLPKRHARRFHRARTFKFAADSEENSSGTDMRKQPSTLVQGTSAEDPVWPGYFTLPGLCESSVRSAMFIERPPNRVPLKLRW